jgi:hypothetical protein
MNFRDSNVESVDGKYLSKRVMVNGQFVTLYSANGQTWVSSPEELPALMDRLENARITLGPGEKVPEGEPAAAPVKAEPAEEEKPAPPKVLQTKYRMKGPKPRPILRQGGVVIMGTPIEPISASNTALTFSSDVTDEEESGTKQKNSKVSAKKGAGKAAALPAATSKAVKGKQTDSHKKMIAPVLSKPAASKAEASKSKTLAKVAKVEKVAAPKSAAKHVTKPTPKSAVKATATAKAGNSKKAEAKKQAKQIKKAAAQVKRSPNRPAKAAAKKGSAKKGK